MLPHEESAGRHILLVVACVLIALVLSFVLCIPAMRTAVGVVNMPGSILGISRPNFVMVMQAGSVIGALSAAATWLVLAVANVRLRWLAVFPAVLLPTLGACGFLACLIISMA